MGWRTVVVSQHAKVSTLSRNLVVQNDQGTYPIPISDIDIVVLETTQVMISADAVASLAEAAVPVVFAGHNGQPVAKTMGTSFRNQISGLIRRQAAWPRDRIDRLWTTLVATKIANQAQVLDYQQQPADDLRGMIDELELGDPTNREAVAARSYFRKLFGDGFSRSDMCAINAALNYGYALLLALIDREIVATGHLTSLGIHHDSQDNEFNLGSDLMEPFRPLVDVWVANQKFDELTPDVKHGLADLFNMEITFNSGQTLFRNALTAHVRSCLHYLDEDEDNVEIEVLLPDEVSNHAINDHV
ncbi:type II CRISPR-associated endonuclease Cas1 [Lacticaseibacillus kribbianus]|uniref:type II CRISPR-associated endonuclease Cas1 n=1 Tax=Lacticaseibacillus kribbianus TaxID=2926292 RepID=UPI001CD1C89F|nr:type II CRISPR-associated endonuclease Cas1 [Lacticaseibacillus kribbianus]